MAHGLAVSNRKWYVKNAETGAAECGPFSTEEAATKARDLKAPKCRYDLKVEEVDIVRLTVHRRPLPQTWEKGKPVPASS